MQAGAGEYGMRPRIVLVSSDSHGLIAACGTGVRQGRRVTWQEIVYEFRQP
jgi:hypothetical protein